MSRRKGQRQGATAEVEAPAESAAPEAEAAAEVTEAEIEAAPEPEPESVKEAQKPQAPAPTERVLKLSESGLVFCEAIKTCLAPGEPAPPGKRFWIHPESALSLEARGCLRIL